MIGFELKGKQGMLSYTQNYWKRHSDFLAGFFYSYVSDTQPSSHPFIQSSMAKQ
jgi:hypothetical protein